MSKRALWERVGEGRFKKLMETMTVRQISTLLCPHHSKDELRAKCQACRRAIYRSIKTLKEGERAEKSLEPIDNFDQIPEIHTLREHMKASGAKHRQIVRSIERMWTWIRESDRENLKRKQRPALWDEETVTFLLSKIEETGQARYNWVQALRRLFESQHQLCMLKHRLLRARRRDMRPKNGNSLSRVKDYATPQEFNQMLDVCDTEKAKLKLKVHVTLKCREGSYKEHRQLGASFCNLKWERVIWRDTYYGAPKVTMAVFEPKTGGGTLWTHCPLDLYWTQLPQAFRAYWESQGCPKEGFVWGEDTYIDYNILFKKIRERTGLNFTPHDLRRTGATWLHDLGLDNLAIGQYDPRTGIAIGYGGVGWENAEIYYQRYGRLSKEAVRKLHAYVHEETYLDPHGLSILTPV